VPLALAALRRPWLAAASGGVLSGVQVVPAIALFALLIPALAALLACSRRCVPPGSAPSGRRRR
jgi:ABC-type proline/glycine betaine transport system permease subunit